MEETARAEKKAEREKKRRRVQMVRKIKVGAGLCIGLAVLLYLLSAFVFFKVESIEVIGTPDENGESLPGSSYYSSEEIVRVSGVNTGDSLVLVSKKNTKDSIEKLLPYIGNVKVQRKYPSTLRLVVEDTSAVYALDAGGGYTILNEEYKVLSVTEKMPLGSAKIVGISVVNAEIGTIAEFTDEAYKTRLDTIREKFKKSGITDITKINVENIANVSITINGRFTFILGTLTQLEEKLSMASKTMETEIANNPDARIIIDVKDPERSYVRDDYSPVENEYESEENNSEIPENNDEPVMDDIPEDVPEAVG
ncbi:MAG: FtsQ-type POTRA domain-containing protein [Clostridia bacterium]|nr:FtsQ-type POTRA domain-containing protein [Clostridia bacterium]